MTMESENIITSEYRIQFWYNEYMKKYEANKYFLDSITRKIS